MKNVLLYIGVILLFGCKKEVGPQFVDSEGTNSGSKLILNEGNFGFGNASISVYNPETKTKSNNQYRTINGVGIGDVLQSVNRYQDKFYFVVNNSGKVVITDTNLVYQSEILGFNSPRYIEFYGDQGFVTDLKQKAVYVVDLMTSQITNQIKTKGWTETMLFHNNQLLVLDKGNYLSNNSANIIYSIDPETLIKEDSLTTFINPNSMVIDGNNNLWVLSSGKTGIESPKLSKYDISTNTLISSMDFSNSSTPSKLTLNADKDKLMFINKSIYQIDINSVSLPSTPSFSETGENFYGLSIDNRTGEIYLFDAKDYNQKGSVLRLNSSFQSLR